MKKLLSLFLLFMFLGFLNCDNTESKSKNKDKVCEDCDEEMGPPIDDTNLIIYYKFNSIDSNNIEDKSGNGFYAENYGATLVPGKFGNAVSFNGSAYIKIPPISILNNIDANDYSFLIWIRTSHVIAEGSFDGIFCKHENDTNNYIPFEFYIEPGGEVDFIQFNWDVTQGGFVRSNSISLNDGVWHLIAVVHKDNILYLYIDGNFILDSDGVTIHPTVNTANIYIGLVNRRNLLQKYYTGLIDEFLIYSRAVSEKEIKDYFDSGKEAY